MSEHTIKRIAGVIEAKFINHIDMTDWDNKPPTDRHIAFLSRGLAALAIHRLTGADPEIAAQAVTDGHNDCGVDAVYFEQATDTIYFVQSKWSKDGSKTIDLGSVSNFIDGIGKILNDDFASFNQKLREKEAELRAVLYSGTDVKFRVVLIHTGEQSISFHAEQRVRQYINELNVPVRLAEAEFLNQKETYELIVSEHSVRSISLSISLREFGFLAKPYLSYYGRAHVIDVAKWWRDHGNNICTRNLRQLIPRSDINDALLDTIKNDPENFWYLNNGITIICNSAKRAGVNMDNTHFGIFHCEGVSVVNGAQTVGVIGEALGDQAPESLSPESRINDAWVHVRIIPLEGCPQEFDRRITEATNFQNSVERRDFAALDATQHRIATEFALDRKKYAYRSGDERPRDEEGCTLTEATQALACAHSMDLAVQAKREIGLLWADTTKQPYTDLFNRDTNSIHLWKSVVIMRAVEDVLARLRLSGDRRTEVIATHLNRTILNLVFSDPRLRAWKDDTIEASDMAKRAAEATPEIFAKVANYIKEKHEGDYLAALSKNRDKCVALKESIIHPLDQRDLFDRLRALDQPTS